MNYQIIKDQNAFCQFIDWLPECAPVEQYYVSLFARKKYTTDPSVKYDKSQLRRFTSTKERLFGKVYQLQCPLGAYRGEEEKPIPQEALALYISPNPRDLQRCFLKSIKKFAEIVESGRTANPRQEVMSVIQTTKSRTCYHVFDIDSKDETTLKFAVDLLNGECAVIETRGGYHVLADNLMVHTFPKNWYLKMKEISDVAGDALIPVVGCTQGNFIPRFKFLNNNFM